MSVKMEDKLSKADVIRAVKKLREASELDINLEIRDILMQDKASTDRLDSDLGQIPFIALERLGRVFVEGERYGRDNWRKGVRDKIYQLERLNHALRHLLVYGHKLKYGEYLGESVEEDDLAKVMWFCSTQCELERLEGIENGGK